MFDSTFQSASSEDSAENHADREQSPETEGNGLSAAAAAEADPPVIIPDPNRVDEAEEEAESAAVTALLAGAKTGTIARDIYM